MDIEVKDTRNRSWLTDFKHKVMEQDPSVMGKKGVGLLLDHIEKLEKEREWVSVEDGLPEDGWEYLVLVDTGGFENIAPYREVRVVTRFTGYWDRKYDKYITHWMPKPKAPKEVCEKCQGFKVIGFGNFTVPCPKCSKDINND